MRILQVVPALKFGGVETGTLDLAKALKRKGHDVWVLSSGGERVKELLKIGISHVTLPVHKKSLFTLRLIPKVRQLIERERIQVVHASSRVPAWVAYWATRGTQAAFVTSCHGYYSTHFLSRVMGWGKEVIVISRMVGRHMIEEFEVPFDRVHLVYRGVDLSQYPFDSEKYSRSNRGDRFVVAHIGRIAPIKGHIEFIKSMHLVLKDLPHLEAWIVGDPDPGKEGYLEELKRLVKGLGLDGTVRFLGARGDIPSILSRSDLLVLSSRVPEGFGRVLLEAGASGTCIIGPHSGAVPEFVTNHEDGILIPPGDEKTLAEAVISILKNPERARELAHHFRAKVESQFSLETMVEKTLEVYEKVLERRKVLVFKVGALGDVILATPSLRTIRKKLPRAFISVLVDSRWASVLQDCPYVDEVIAFDRTGRKGRLARWLKLAKRLRRSGFDLSIDLQNNRKSHWLAFLSGIPLRYGYARGFSSRLLTHRAASFSKALPPVEHQFRVLAMAGLGGGDPRLELWVREEDRLYVDKIFEKAWVNPHQRKIGFALSASREWVTKNWPLEYFVDLGRRLEQTLNARIILIGDEKDKGIAADFKNGNLRSVIDLTGATDVGQLIALIEHLDLLVAGDSAPIHIAAAVGTPCVALFGPTDPRRHLPPGSVVSFFKKDLSCSPCYSRRCRVKVFACMPGIEVSEVFDEVRKRVKRGSVAKSHEEREQKLQTEGNRFTEIASSTEL